MFIWAILAALAVSASAQFDENCARKSTGVTSTKARYLVATIKDGYCNLRVDLSSVPDCNNQGVVVGICDKDARPLVSISNDMTYVDIKREGHCRDEITGHVQVYCEKPVEQTRSSSGGGKDSDKD